MKRSTIGILTALTAMYACYSSISEKGTNDGSIGHGIPDKPKDVIPNGCKEYWIEGERIIAISEKSAVKKYNRKFKQLIKEEQ